MLLFNHFNKIPAGFHVEEKKIQREQKQVEVLKNRRM
jgi:hypothetical protein